MNQYNIWHPFTQEKTSNLPIKIKSGHGSFLTDENGKKYVDLISSWWTNIHGHCNEYIINAVKNQLDQLDHVIFADFTHDPAINLIKELRQHLDPSFEKFFFSDNGSTSVEVAIKIAYQFHKNSGNKREMIVAFDGSYHGDTTGSMSVSKKSEYFKPFEKLMFDVKFLPYVDTFIGDSEIETKERDAILLIEKFFEKEYNNIACFIIEPLVQGASGMRMCRSSFLNKVVSLAKKYSIITIFDEVMTGFGRTGKMFAYQNISFTPDIICLSKGLTGGVLPLAITATNIEIYNAFYSEDSSKTFLHGHTYTANPISCSAAVASLDLFKKNNSLLKVSQIEDLYQNICNTYILSKPRFIGGIFAFNIEKNLDQIKNIKYKLMDKGLLVRPIKDTMCVIPNYEIDLNLLKSSIEEIINIAIFDN